VDSQPDDTFKIADTDDASLDNFFSRPVKIRSFAWGTGTQLYEFFNPWQAFFENPRVINRISNYNLLRCKLHVRFVLNGNSFHYGRAIASYLPLYSFDELTEDRPLIMEDTIEASQRPHIYIDPTTSQGGTLTLPFCYMYNALNIPEQDWRDMGQMSVRGIQELKHANGASDQVIISVFAWAEEVSLSIPTANEPGALVPQMAEVFDPQVKDEYGTGPISRPAGVIAKAAGALSKFPVIGVYARATELAASATSGIASMFGYSRPVELANIQPYKPVYLGNMANTNVPDTSQKLTLDAKQELTIDPRVMGLGDADEMTILSIAQRESYLTSFPWNVSSPAEQLLWNSHVSPVLWAETTVGEELHFPACCFATLPFRRWRGSMKFRFQIVASAFHKGRLKIVYDPSYPVTNEYNTNYTYIVDLAKERDFTVQIGWGNHASIVNHLYPGADPPPYSTAQLPPPGQRSCNGIISVYVVNDLTVPNSTANNDIEVNVFVSAGDDFQVYDPDTNAIEDLVWFQPQISEVFSPQMGEPMSPDADLTIREDEPMKLEPSHVMAPATTMSDHTDDVYYGDPIVSFRQCLKRYNYHSSICPAGPLGTSTFLSVMNSNFPYYRGYAPGAVHNTIIPGPGAKYNYCKMTLLNYITPAYTCRRGALRWKYFRTEGNTEETSMMTVARESNPAFGYNQLETPLLATDAALQSDRVRQYTTLMDHLWDGGTVTSTRHNPVIEAEIPFYTNLRFFPAKQADMTSSAGGFRQYHNLTTVWESALSDKSAIHCYSSIGEDFNLGLYVGPPIAYRVPNGFDPPGD